MAYVPPRAEHAAPNRRATRDRSRLQRRFPAGLATSSGPTIRARQPYGPYPTFDISMDPPPPKDPHATTQSFPWIEATTAAAGFPVPEVLDGCRKAPIMTIGINPNLTAFAPGTDGCVLVLSALRGRRRRPTCSRSTPTTTATARCSRSGSTSSWVEQFLLPEPRVVATKAGSVVVRSAPDRCAQLRPPCPLRRRRRGHRVHASARPGHAALGCAVRLPRPDARASTAGDTIAAKLDVPAGQPVAGLPRAGRLLRAVRPGAARRSSRRSARAGTRTRQLQMGEDVCQLDMVATRSPHWTTGLPRRHRRERGRRSSTTA